VTELVVSIGKVDPADITKTWRGPFSEFVKTILKRVPETDDKASAGWVCGAEFTDKRRHGKNFVGRHLLSIDYDHIVPSDLDKIFSVAGQNSHLIYTTHSHTPEHPRYRVWIPLSRACSAVEFQAVSRAWAAKAGIELAARESHTPAQFMYRPTRKEGIEFQTWQNLEAPPLDVDKILGEYDDYKDRSTWPHRKENDSCHDPEPGESPLEKPGIVGEWCRAFTISEAIERFQLPYTSGSSEGRWTYTAGSRADGAVAYDDDTKLHSYHDTDPARGQTNAYDLVRLHLFGRYDAFDGADVSLAERDSSRRMAEFAAAQPEIAAARFNDAGFSDLGPLQESLPVEPANAIVATATMPTPIVRPNVMESDLGNACRMQTRYGANIISVGGIFYLWSGTHWIKNDAAVVRQVSNLSACVAKESEQAKAAGDDDRAKALWRWAAHCASTAALSSCQKLLRSHLDFNAAHLNPDKALLTCRSGTIDLRTGQVRPPRQEDFITACAPTEFDPNALAPRFARFLQEIFKGDADTIEFTQRWFGFCITGEVTPNAIVFHVGEGGNGKSKLIEALQYVLGSGYAGPGARGLLSPKSGGASPEVADLLGRRMVTLTETNRNEEFDEGVLKHLSGGDMLKARNLYEGFIEFQPTHKLQLFTNHEPRIIGQDRGIWRRIYRLQYDVKYGDRIDVETGVAHALQDEDLPNKLAAEAAGILAWLVEGARQYYAQGLNAPASVKKATADFKARQDTMGQFLLARTVNDPSASVLVSGGSESLYTAYKGWMTQMGYRPMGIRTFIDELRPRKILQQGKVFPGLRLVDESLE
jgi:P4 family phage/plasmid primase-like protien